MACAPVMNLKEEPSTLISVQAKNKAPSTND